MGKIKVVESGKAPAAIGAYSQAVVYGNQVYCSGQIGLDPGTGDLVPGGITAQTRQVMENLKGVIEEAGSGMYSILKCSIFLADIDDFEAVNEVYSRYFSDNPPARETLAVKALPKGALVEISCIAALEI